MGPDERFTFRRRERCRKKIEAQSERRFLFDLALRLNKTVAELERLPSSELTEWMAYFSLEEKAMQREEAKHAKAKREADIRNRMIGGE